MPEISVITLVNNPRTYAAMRASLAEQLAPEAVEWLPVQADLQGWTAAVGLNHGLDQARGAFALCVHQDVLFPPQWWHQAKSQLARLPAAAGVFGLVGCRANGQYVGHVLDPHGHGYWHELPTDVISIDEHVLLLRMSAGLRFDPHNPGFHCYGTDVALAAWALGHGAYVIDAPVVHLSGGRVDASFHAAGEWLLEKWGSAWGYVLPTCARIVSDPRRRSLWRFARVYLTRRFGQRRRRGSFRAMYAE